MKRGWGPPLNSQPPLVGRAGGTVTVGCCWGPNMYQHRQHILYVCSPPHQVLMEGYWATSGQLRGVSVVVWYLSKEHLSVAHFVAGPRSQELRCSRSQREG